jgi:hypothetical protein
VTHPADVKAFFTPERMDADKIAEQIEKDKKGPRGKAVRKKLREIEKQADEL